MTAPISTGGGASQAPGDALRLCACLVQGCSELQPRNNSHPGGICNSQCAAARIGFELQRGVNLYVLVVSTQGLRHDSHNGDGATIQKNLLPDNGWISMKASVPAAEGENHYGVSASDLFVLSKVTAQQRLKAERGEPVGTHQ